MQEKEGKMRDYKKLMVWEKASNLCVDIYNITSCFPSGEKFGMTAQLRRAAVSVVANIAEGCGRRTDADFCRFIDIATGSCSEVEALLQLSERIWGPVDNDYPHGRINRKSIEQCVEQVIEIRRMLSGLADKMRI